jgi:hypothetical protein
MHFEPWPELRPVVSEPVLKMGGAGDLPSICLAVLGGDA